MFGRNRHHHARADDSAGLSPSLSVVFLALTACFAEFKHHVGSVLLPSWC